MNRVEKDAVSPVVGVMLMLVVTIIIAAVVSGFAGGLANTQSKAPQAKISATFSVSQGMTITHDGGDAIPLNDLVFITQNGEGFGPNTESLTTEEINRSIITDKEGDLVLLNTSGSKSSFNPGDTLYISAYNCTAPILQPDVGSSIRGWDWEKNPTYYKCKSGGYICYASLWYLCYRNPNNVGKNFIFQAGDRSGNIISSCDVTITS
ncbi:type IV pilin N-terminal domain-containing protein [Methanolacinia paynteri]|uniref:type IV pilin N-terminal domain-containing protein n=1 Tax=Methanolacinia paynteri TaxID=230356 RepID=UPI0006937139|nr:type IV pilin N-terminal domain-containing protein [Methanolacinia paynteri]